MAIHFLTTRFENLKWINNNIKQKIDNNNFKIPNQLTLLSTDSLGRSQLTVDSYSESFQYIGGSVDRGEYRFNFARELNNILKNYSMNLPTKKNNQLNVIK